MLKRELKWIPIFGWGLASMRPIAINRSAGRSAITHVIEQGKALLADGVWIRIFPDKPITKKPLEVRQGKGKGSVEYWVAQIQPGKILYEMEGVSEEIAREAFTLAASKLPIATQFVSRQVLK